MIKIKHPKIALTINTKKLQTLKVKANRAAANTLADIWYTDAADLDHYYAVFYDKTLSKLSDKASFVTLSFSRHGYVSSPEERINLSEVEKQIGVDLEIINREAQWSKEESIYFDQWWPKPTFNASKHMLEFGVSLKDHKQNVFNRTLNRLILTRYGHLVLNYSLSEGDIKSNHPLYFYQHKLDEVLDAMAIQSGYGYQDIDKDSDRPSKSRMVNLVLMSEIF